MLRFRSRIRAAICVGLLYLSGGSIATGGTIMPPGETTFFDSNGVVLSAGCVFFYIPGTTSAKATYQNAAQTIANTNPVLLDAAGRAIIYGTGTYRQIVQQAPCPGGTQIWDQLTASTDSSATIFAGASAGTPNAITVTAAAFSGTDGQVINYISTNTNTGGATINPSGFGAVAIVRDSATGPGALTGGELVATNSVSLIYDATAGTFHILSPVTWPNTSGVPVGATIAISGFTAPTNYAFAYGQAVSRTSFSSLLSAYTSAQTGSISSGSPTITGLSDTTQFAKGQFVEAVGIPAAATLLSCTSTTCTMSANATTTRTGTMTFFAYGNGDGSITFNLPDYRGRDLRGRDNMGGTAANVMQASTTVSTTSGSSSATVLSAAGLAIGMYISGNPNIVPGSSILTISGTTITFNSLATATQSTVATRFSTLLDAQGLGIAGGAQSQTFLQANLPNVNFAVSSGTVSWPIDYNQNGFTAGGVPGVGTIAPGNTSHTTTTNAVASGWTAASGGSGTPFTSVPPAAIVNWAVRLTP